MEGSGYSSDTTARHSLARIPTNKLFSKWEGLAAGLVDYDMLLNGFSSEPALSGPGAVQPRGKLVTTFLTAQGDRRGGCHAGMVNNHHLRCNYKRLTWM